MQSFITTTQLPSLAAITGRGAKVTANEVALAQFFSHGDSMRLLMPWLSYLDCLSLSRALIKLAPQIKSKMPSFSTVVNSQLKAIGVKVDLVKLVQTNTGVITGSFLMHCLLQPLSALGYSKIFPPGSDIDLLSNADDKVKCPHCLKRLLGFCHAPAEIMRLDGGGQFNWLVAYGRRRLNQNRQSKPGSVLHNLMQQIKTDALTGPNGAYNGNIKGYDFPHLNKKAKSRLSVALCPHLTFVEKQRGYLALPTVGRNIWVDANGFKFDDVFISADSSIQQWMRDSIDFGFCQNSFDGNRLHIHKPHQLLHRHCQYQLDSKLIGVINCDLAPAPGVTISFDGDQVLIKTDIQTFRLNGSIPILFIRSNYEQTMQCYNLLKTYVIRGYKYIGRGFRIDFSHKLTTAAILNFVNNSHCAGDLGDEIIKLIRSSP